MLLLCLINYIMSLFNVINFSFYCHIIFVYRLEYNILLLLLFRKYNISYTRNNITLYAHNNYTKRIIHAQRVVLYHLLLYIIIL